MDELSSCDPGWHRVEVTVSVTAGDGDMSAAEFLQALDQVGNALDRGGIPVAMMATSVTIAVIVQAGGPISAMYAGAEAVEVAVTGRRLKVIKSRYAGAATPPAGTREAAGTLTAGAGASLPHDWHESSDGLVPAREPACPVLLW